MCVCVSSLKKSIYLAAAVELKTLNSFKLKYRVDQLWYVPPDAELNARKRIFCVRTGAISPCYRFQLPGGCSMMILQKTTSPKQTKKTLSARCDCASVTRLPSRACDFTRGGALLTFHSPFFFTFLITSFIISGRVKIEHNQIILTQEGDAALMHI